MDRSWVKRNLQTLPEASSHSVSFSQSESFRKGNLVGYCRITPSEQSSQSDYRSLATVDKATHEVVAIQRLESTGEERMSRFGIDTVFDHSCDNEMLRNNMISVEDKNSILCWFWEGFNVSLISYGEVNSGKTFSLFGKQRYDEKCIFEQVSEVLFDLVQANNEGDLGKYLVGLSVFEILYTQDDRCEVVKDLLRISDLKPLSLSSPLELVTVKINSVEEAMFTFNCARNLSHNWKETSEGEFMPINNRAHFFIRFSLYSEHDSRLRHLHIIDLAGSPPANMPQDIRNKLGSEEQLNFTRIGLNQLRSILWELARLNSATNESIDLSTILATRKSKLASVLGPIIASNSRTYLLGVLREDAAFSDSCRTLELIQRAQSITVPCVKGIEIAKTQLEFIQFSVFSSRHKGARNIAQKVIGLDESRGKSFRLSELQKAAESKPHSRSRSISPHERKLSPSMDIPKNPKEDNFGRTIAWLNDFTAKKDQVLARARSGKETPPKYISKYEKEDRSFSPKHEPSPKPSVKSSPVAVSEKNIAPTPKTPKREGILKPASPSYKATKMKSLKDEISQMLGELEKSVSTPSIHQPTSRPDHSFKWDVKEAEEPRAEKPRWFEPDSYPQLDISKSQTITEPYIHTPVQFPTFTYTKEPSDHEISYQKDSTNQKGEYYILKRNYDSLVTVMQEQEELRASQEAKIETLESELSEIKTTYELQLDDLKLENNRLKQQLRIIKESHEMSEIFDMYEMEIQRLNSHITAMRLTINDTVEKLERAHEPTAESSDVIEESVILQKQRRNALQEIRNSIKKQMKELGEKDYELAELKKQQRKWETSRKCLANVTKRTGKLQFVVEKQKESLAENENITSQIATENRQLKSQNKSLNAEIESLKQEQHELIEELKLMREMATATGLNPETIDKIHQNIKNASEPKSKFVMNLLKRLQKEIHLQKDPRLSQQIDNAILEMSEVLTEIQNASIREQNLLHMLVDLQEKLERDNKSVSRQTNRMLRNSLLAKLTS